MNKLTITVVGNDRPGILSAISGNLLKLDCNIENVSQTILQSEFAGIFIVSAPEDLALDTLHETIQGDLAGMGLHVHVKPLTKQDEPFAREDAEPFIVVTIGPDRKGLVAEIASVIAGYGVNIANLKAVFKGGNDPNKNIMAYEIEIPKSVDLQSLTDDLKTKAKKMDLDLSIQHRKIFDTINRI